MHRIFSHLSTALTQGVLLGLCALPLCPPLAWAGNEANAPALASYTTKTGDTVERVLKNAMPDSPLNPQLLRKALAEANPQVVTGKAGQKFKSGSVIQLPDHGALVRNTLDTLASPGGDTAYRSGYGASDPASRRHWVRYP